MAVPVTEKNRAGHLVIRPCVHLYPQGEHLSWARLPGRRGERCEQEYSGVGLGGYVLVALRGWTVN